VSIGGTLTSYAAPPVLMLASAWQWDSGFMLAHFGWKAAVAVLVNATVANSCSCEKDGDQAPRYRDPRRLEAMTMPPSRRMPGPTAQREPRAKPAC
jgi:hypothetical protein